MSQGVVMMSKRKVKESAEKATLRFKTEQELTKHLCEKMFDHPYLQCGFAYRIDRKQIEIDMKGLIEKFRIHGYEDRGLRMTYLQEMLLPKVDEEPETYLNMLRFLILMSESPTNVIHMKLETGLYSAHPNKQALEDGEKSNQKNADFESTDLNNEKDRLHLQYSSDSDLSDWQVSDGEDYSEKLEQLTREKSKVRLSRSFSEFRQITEITEEEKRKEMELFWKQQNQEAKIYMHTQLRQVELISLKNQPIISSLLNLHSKFGEFWEWKFSSHDKQQGKLLILEEDIIREILWKISHPSPEYSVIFTNDWQLKKELMVSSLSPSILMSFLAKYKLVIRKLHQLHNFVNEVADYTLGRGDQDISCRPPKLYNAYAHGLSEIFNYITEVIAGIEKNLNKDCWKEGNPQPATTFTQMDRSLRHCFEIVNAIKRFHDQGVSAWKEDANSNAQPHWFCSIKLISSIEMYLNLQTRPKEYGIILFIFSKCIRAFFEDIILAFDSLEWSDTNFYIKRDSNVNIRECDFWSKSITIQPYAELLHHENLTPLLCLDELMPKVAGICKTLEMLRQLGEDFRNVIGKVSSSDTIVHDFIVKLLPNWGVEIPNVENAVVLKHEPDFNSHFRYLGLEGSFVADSMRFVVNPVNNPIKSKEKEMYNLQKYVQISEIPVSSPGEILKEVVKRWINPYHIKSQKCIQSIFKSYNVAQSMAIFQEIVLEGREDFARAVTLISVDTNKSEKFHYEDPLNRNPRFQLLLDEYYPEGREHFQIDFVMESSSSSGIKHYKFNVTLNFPLNIVISPKSLGGYTYITMQLQKVRNSLWRINALKMKDCKPLQNLELNRVLILRFSLIHYCSSILSFLLFKIFKNSVENMDLCRFNEEEDVDNILKVHETYLNELQVKIFKHPLFENVILKQMVSITQVISERWNKGISAKAVIVIEDTLKKCWAVIASSRSNLIAPGTEFSELSCHVGPPPGYL